MPTCFVIMPITTPSEVREAYRDPAHFAHVLEHLFTPALEAAGYEVWPPAASGSDLIQGEIIRQLDQADLVLCDMTSLNANVFFELGIRTALDKPVAMVKDQHTDKIPFDVGSMNCHDYDGRMEPWTLPAQVEALTAHLQACVSRSAGQNTLWKYLGIEAQARVGSAGTGEDDKLDYLVRQIEDLRADVRWPSSPRQDPDDQMYVTNEVDAVVRRFLDEAWTIAQESGTSFTAYFGDQGTVVLDFGPMYVSDGQLHRIARLARSADLALSFEGLQFPGSFQLKGARIAHPS